MSGKIIKTVEYEIEPNGNCYTCKSLYEEEFGAGRCMAFDMAYVDTVEQCQACKDYLAEIKSRVYCDGCKYRVLSCRNNNFNGCKLRNPQGVNPDGRYSINCNNRTE